MGDFLTKTFYGNTIVEWLISLAIIGAAIVVGKVLYWVCRNLVRRITSKTKTKIDDILIDTIEEPLVLAVSIAGIWIGLSRLTFPAAATAIINGGVNLLLILTASWLLVRLLDALCKEYLAPLADKSENDLDDQLLPLVRKGTKTIIWSVGIIVGLNNMGYDVGALIAGLGIGGLALAMAAKDTVSNFFGGITIFTDRPFSVGDRIRIAGHDGTVKEIGIRSTRLQTLSGTVVTIPNSTFQASSVENVTLEPSRKVGLSLGLTYDTQPDGMRRAMDLLRAIVVENQGTEEKVVVAFDAFGDFSMNIKLIYYVKKSAGIMSTMNDVNLAILERFNAAGLEFAFPTQTVFHHSRAAG